MNDIHSMSTGEKPKTQKNTKNIRDGTEINKQ